MLSLLLPACLFSAGRIGLVGDGPKGPQITFAGASGQAYIAAGEGGTTVETASEFTAKDVYVETSEMGLAEALGKIGTMETQVAELYGLVQNLTAAVAAGGTTRGSCSTGGHEWSNVAQESCYAGNSCHNTACANAPHQYVNGVACCTGSFCGSVLCTATVQIVGCY